jgi:hypothetical protein
MASGGVFVRCVESGKRAVSLTVPVLIKLAPRAGRRLQRTLDNQPKSSHNESDP